MCSRGDVGDNMAVPPSGKRLHGKAWVGTGGRWRTHCGAPRRHVTALPRRIGMAPCCRLGPATRTATSPQAGTSVGVARALCIGILRIPVRHAWDERIRRGGGGGSGTSAEGTV